MELQNSDLVSGETVTAFLGSARGGVSVSIFSVNGGEFEGCISADSARELAAALVKLADDAKLGDQS